MSDFDIVMIPILLLILIGYLIYKSLPPVVWYGRLGMGIAILFGLLNAAAYVVEMLLGSTPTAVVLVLSILGAYMLYHFRPKAHFDTKDRETTHYDVAVYVVLGLLIWSYLFNAYRFATVAQSLPVIGANDDAVTHMGMAIMSIREQGLLFQSDVVSRVSTLLDTHIAGSPYPFGLYYVTNFIYTSIHGAPSSTHDFHLDTLFNIQSLLTFGLFTSLLVMVFAIGRRIYRASSPLVFVPIFLSGIFFVVSAFFIDLYFLGFIAQIAGYFLLMSTLYFLDTTTHDPHAYHSPYVVGVVGVLLFGVGVTYYLFIPLSGVIILTHFIFKRHLVRLQDGVPLATVLALSAFPFVYHYLLSQNVRQVSEQYTVMGISYYEAGHIMGLGLCVWMGIYLRRRLATSSCLITVLLALYGFTLFQIIASVIVSIALTGATSYYVYKSFFTLGLVSMPLYLAWLSHRFQMWDTTSHLKFRRQLLILCVGVGIVYGVFSVQPGFEKLKAMMYLHNGLFNFWSPRGQKIWIETYEKYRSNPAIEVAPVGYWGEVVLVSALYERMPPIYKEFYARRQLYFTHHPEAWVTSIEKYVKSGHRIIVLDTRDVFASYRNHMQDTK